MLRRDKGAKKTGRESLCVSVSESESESESERERVRVMPKLYAYFESFSLVLYESGLFAL